MMATRLLDRVPVDRITEQAQTVNLGRTLLKLLPGLFWLLGWLAGMVAVGVSFAWASVVTGWRDAHAQAGRPARARSA